MSYIEWRIWATSIVSVKRCVLHWQSVQIRQIFIIRLTCVAISRVLDNTAHAFVLNNVIEYAEFSGRSFMAPRWWSRLLRSILQLVLISKEYLMILLLMWLPRLMIFRLYCVRLLCFDYSDRWWSNHLHRCRSFLLSLTLRSQIRCRLSFDCFDLTTLVPCR